MKGRLAQILDAKGPIRRIGIVGMGYVGIPSAMLFADRAFEWVWGFQRDSPSSGYKIDMLNRGENPLVGDEPGLQELIQKVVQGKKFRCTSDFSKIAEVDALTFTIQTPFIDKRSLQHDFRALRAGLQEAGKHITQGTLVVLESTVAPGTTEGLARNLLEKESNMVAGEDFALAHAPERVAAGRLLRNIQELDRIVGGINKASTDRAVQLYRCVLTTGRVIPMSAKAAEVTKTAENAFRDLQIAAVNELALYCEAMGVNVYDVRTGINSLKGEGVSRAVLSPGAGVGGHCLSKDTYLLELGVKESQIPLDYPQSERSLFIVAREVNDFMPKHVVKLIEEALKKIGKGLNDAKIALLGWAFTKNSGDVRDTPSQTCWTLLSQVGAHVSIHDPYVTTHSDFPISSSLKEVVQDADVIVIMTGHSQYSQLDPQELKVLTGRNHPVIVDGRNIVSANDFIANGFIYKGIGRGDKNEHELR